MDPTPDPAPTGDPIGACGPGGRLPRLRVLLVEDEADHADLVAAYLAGAEDPAVDLTHASSVGRAVDLLASARAAGRPFQAVLCDQRLPDSEYWESVERVASEAGEAPVIALTSIGDPDIAVDAMRQGAQDYLVKSELTPELLRRTLRYAVERARHATQLRMFNDALEGRVAEQAAHLRSLAARLAVAEQEERRRIAHLLHDDLQQLLFGLSMTLGLLGGAASPDDREDIVARAERTLDEAMGLTRTLVTELNPSVLGAERFGDALRWLADRVRAAHGVDVDVEGDADVADPTLRALLFHLARELLFNVAKHAGTDRARVTLERAGGSVVVQVEDEGRGFDPATLGAGGGFGLASVRERLEAVGGSLSVDSRPGAGARFTLRVPTGAPHPLRD